MKVRRTLSISENRKSGARDSIGVVVVSPPSFVPFMTLFYDLERGYLGNVLMDRRRRCVDVPQACLHETFLFM